MGCCGASRAIGTTNSLLNDPLNFRLCQIESMSSTNKELNSIFRVKTSFLPNKIIFLTNHINEFQTQQSFINAANLYKGNVNNFLGVQPRNILLQIVRKINEYHKVQSHDYIIDCIPPPDQKESNENITKQITNLCSYAHRSNTY